ncbi:MAG: DUF6391 domain-containing protein [Chloroflexi bacterium]|nr:DUF6391 domain-containing protein [Chloroflexota bacterium]
MLGNWIDAVRRNHGVEHATVAVLFARTGPQRIAGRASADGFFILGSVDETQLLSCAREALDRMQRGEAELAVSPHCGTNIAVTAALSTLATMKTFAKQSDRPLRDRFGDAFTGSIFAIIAAQPLGRLLQRYVTTRADVDGMQIVEVRSYLPGVRKVITSGA